LQQQQAEPLATGDPSQFLRTHYEKLQQICFFHWMGKLVAQIFFDRLQPLNFADATLVKFYVYLSAAKIVDGQPIAGLHSCIRHH
jgi:hypothetical protein